MIDQAINQPSDVFMEITDEIFMPSLNSKDETIIGVRCIPFRDRLSRTLGSITVFNDITALKKIDQLKSDFVSMVAHEIKSPLNSVLMQLNVVLDGLTGELTKKQKTMLQKSSKRVQSVTTLATELLDLSKIESGLINQEREVLDLGELINTQAELFKEKADSRSIELKTEKIDKKMQIMGNRMNIEEVVSNLISNSIRYSADGHKITLSAAKKNGSIQIQVRDTGFGIPEKDLPNIFNKFFRAKNEKTININGTGLGLAIVQSIVEAHHGTIEVDSVEGEGTSVSILLPRYDAL
jgi:signal transduction histidine kinase